MMYNISISLKLAYMSPNHAHNRVAMFHPGSEARGHYALSLKYMYVLHVLNAPFTTPVNSYYAVPQI